MVKKGLPFRPSKGKQRRGRSRTRKHLTDDNPENMERELSMQDMRPASQELPLFDLRPQADQVPPVLAHNPTAGYNTAPGYDLATNYDLATAYNLTQTFDSNAIQNFSNRDPTDSQTSYTTQGEVQNVSERFQHSGYFQQSNVYGRGAEMNSTPLNSGGRDGGNGEVDIYPSYGSSGIQEDGDHLPDNLVDENTTFEEWKSRFGMPSAPGDPDDIWNTGNFNNNSFDDHSYEEWKSHFGMPSAPGAPDDIWNTGNLIDDSSDNHTFEAWRSRFGMPSAPGAPDDIWNTASFNNNCINNSSQLGSIQPANSSGNALGNGMSNASILGNNQAQQMNAASFGQPAIITYGAPPMDAQTYLAAFGISTMDGFQELSNNPDPLNNVGDSTDNPSSHVMTHSAHASTHGQHPLAMPFLGGSLPPTHDQQDGETSSLPAGTDAVSQGHEESDSEDDSATPAAPSDPAAGIATMNEKLFSVYDPDKIISSIKNNNPEVRRDIDFKIVRPAEGTPDEVVEDITAAVCGRPEPHKFTMCRCDFHDKTKVIVHTYPYQEDFDWDNEADIRTLNYFRAAIIAKTHGFDLLKDKEPAPLPSFVTQKMVDKLCTAKPVPPIAGQAFEHMGFRYSRRYHTLGRLRGTEENIEEIIEYDEAWAALEEGLANRRRIRMSSAEELYWGGPSPYRAFLRKENQDDELSIGNEEDLDELGFPRMRSEMLRERSVETE